MFVSCVPSGQKREVGKWAAVEMALNCFIFFHHLAIWYGAKEVTPLHGISLLCRLRGGSIQPGGFC